MMKVSHNLTAAELGLSTVRERLQATNEQILRCHALLRHQRVSDGLPVVLGTLPVSETSKKFKEAVHQIYQRNGLVLHEFSRVEPLSAA